MATITHVCCGCGVAFERPASAGMPKNAYCSMECRRQRTGKECAYCGKSFDIRPCEEQKKYCSKACQNAAHADALVTVRCQTCGKEFQRKPAKLRESDRHFCSPECAWGALRKPKIVVACLTCGKTMERSPCYVQERNFCSKRCRGLQVPTGPDNPNWRGGKKIRADSGAWQRAVKRAAGYKCQQCGSKDRVAAHHIFPYLNYPEMRYEQKNGVCLCHKCHMAIHHGKQLILVPAA